MLLDARKLAPLERLYAAYGRRLLRRGFARVRVGGAPWPASDAPTIAFLNHSAWWDPILALFLSHDLFRRDGYGLMEGAQLLRYPFFRRVGCFGTTTESFEDVRAVSAHAAALLRGGRRRTLWIFPQGALLPARAPIVFRSGAARFALAVPEARAIPIAVRYELRREQRPEVFVRIGEPVARETAPREGVPRESPARESAAALRRRLEHRLRQELATLDAELERPEPPRYRTVLEGRSSISVLYDRTFGRGAGRSSEHARTPEEQESR